MSTAANRPAQVLARGLAAACLVWSGIATAADPPVKRPCAQVDLRPECKGAKQVGGPTMWGEEFVASTKRDWTSDEHSDLMQKAIDRINPLLYPRPGDWRVRAVGDESLDAAVARTDGAGHPWIFYGKAFESRLRGADQWDAYIVIAHEMAHHLADGTEVVAAAQLMLGEFKADYLAGCVVSVLGASQAQATHVYEERASVEAVNNHPGRADRIAVVIRGWKVGQAKRGGGYGSCYPVPKLP